MNCPDCGGQMTGDGFTVVLHCEEAEDPRYWDKEPDATPVSCGHPDADTVKPLRPDGGDNGASRGD
jgi:hypothetical protein